MDPVLWRLLWRICGVSSPSTWEEVEAVPVSEAVVVAREPLPGEDAEANVFVLGTALEVGWDGRLIFRRTLSTGCGGVVS